MMCPVCVNVELKMTERQGVEIDYCSKCRGIWLDRGELDKIIELSASQRPATATRRPETAADDWVDRDRDDRNRNRDDWDDRDRGKRKRKSLLGDLFDF
ncbi:MAG: zf-TFIIB domain-containing protein [Syntrophomonadaceae bacterium]|jgi:Zn-finger nucleic acid-binding protein|nr:zf-TFIIB domain-containing protein [Syntrophomonadaceae bacterium]